MIDIEQFVDSFIESIESAFGGRIWFCGLQGSRRRGENRPDSDFDMVVILDNLQISDIAAYRQVVRALPYADLACGFLCGVADIMAWDPTDLFHLCVDTKPILGSLEAIWERVDRDSIRRAAWRGACDIFHGCVHNMIYKNSSGVLGGLLKQAVFVIQQLIYLRTGSLILPLTEMLESADPLEQRIVLSAMQARDRECTPLEETSEALFAWAQKTVQAIGARTEC